MDGRKSYEKPVLQDWGTVTELTATGMTQGEVGRDAKGGSVPHSQGV